ncbi:unnamed protein product [Ectocarpus sp. 13 AM-2016]
MSRGGASGHYPLHQHPRGPLVLHLCCVHKNAAKPTQNYVDMPSKSWSLEQVPFVVAITAVQLSNCLLPASQLVWYPLFGVLVYLMCCCSCCYHYCYYRRCRQL